MASSARIEELRKKFEENPRRYFAPLANEYRKAGDVEQAISICRDYLPQQPGHMSGHIVYGQALYEARQYEEAKSVFETALALDPENLIALRHLGDISLILGDTDGARSWYGRVLEADPRNEEIQDQLKAMESAPPGAGIPTPISNPALTASAEADTARMAPQVESFSTAPTVVVTPMPLHIEKSAEEPAVGESAQIAQPSEMGSAPTAEIILDGPPAAARLRPSVTQPIELDRVVPSVPEPPVLDSFRLEGLETTSMEPAEPAPTPVPEPAALPLMDLEVSVPPEPAVVEASAPPVPAGPGDAAGALEPPPGATDLPLIDLGPPAEDFAAAPLAGAAPAEVPPAQVPSSEESPVEARPAVAAATDRPVEPEAPAPGQISATAAEPLKAEVAESRPFVTETMAELYEQQGHREEALNVYRALAEQRPGDTGLREKIGRLEQSRGPTIRELLRLVAVRRPRSATATQPPADTLDEFSAAAEQPERGGEGSQPVPQPVEATAADSAAVATTSRPDALGTFLGAAVIPERDEAAARTLATAFSRNGESGGASGPVPPLDGAPARPAARDLSLDSVFGREGGGQPAGFSFDQFFSERAASEKTPTPAGTAARESADDVARFTQWLEGLKHR